MQLPRLIEVSTMSDEQRSEIVGQVAISLKLTAEDPPSDAEIAEISKALMESEPAFKTWPEDNRHGGQSGYIEALHLRIMETFQKPVQQEEGVADAYMNSHTKLPGDLPAAGISNRPPPGYEET